MSERQCSRPTCSTVAAVTLRYVYADSQVWLDELSAEREPNDYDLCERHASTLTVPVGWHLDDRRRRHLPATADARLLAG